MATYVIFRMEKLFAWLRKPYPIATNWVSLIKGGLIGGAFVAVFLFVFRPFGTYGGLPHWQVVWISIQYGLVTIAWTLVWGFVIWLLPGVFKEENWTVGREIVFHLLFIMGIGTSNLMFSAFMNNYPVTWAAFWQWQKVTVSIGIFPTVAAVMYKQIKLMERYSMAAANLSAQMNAREAMPEMITANKAKEAPEISQVVRLEGDNINESLSIRGEQLAYIAAADNYVQVFYWENTHLKSKILRATLRKMEETLGGMPLFYRCHRTYLVNLQQVLRISGNAQGYKLHLYGIEMTIPVSRALNEEIQQRLLNP